MNNAITTILTTLLSGLLASPSTRPVATTTHELTMPAADARRLGLDGEAGPVRVPISRAAERFGFRLYDAVGGLALVHFAAVDEQPIKFKYAQHFGLYPRIEGGRVFHGGTPLGADLEGHARAIAQNLLRDPAGPGTWAFIDYESWPTALPAGGPYRELAMLQAERRFPELREYGPGARARLVDLLWRRAAREFYVTTIRAAKAARPDLKFGFYHPQARYFFQSAYSGGRAEERRSANDVLGPAWAEADVLAASVYCFYPTGDAERGTTIPYASEAANRRYVRDNVAEFARLEQQTRPEGVAPRPVIAVIEPGVHGSNADRLPPEERRVSEADYRLWMEASRAGGAAGLAVWGEAPDDGRRNGHRVNAPVYGRAFARFVADLAAEATAQPDGR